MENSFFDKANRLFNNIDFERLMQNGGVFLNKIKELSANCGVETTKMMLELYYVMTSDGTSKFNKIIIGLAFAYQFLPNDFLTRDDYGALGFLDNAAALYIAYKRVKKSVTPEIAQKVEDTLKSWGKSISEFTILKPESERI